MLPTQIHNLRLHHTVLFLFSRVFHYSSVHTGLVEVLCASMYNVMYFIQIKIDEMTNRACCDQKHVQLLSHYSKHYAQAARSMNHSVSHISCDIICFLPHKKTLMLRKCRQKAKEVQPDRGRYLIVNIPPLACQKRKEDRGRGGDCVLEAKYFMQCHGCAKNQG